MANFIAVNSLLSKNSLAAMHNSLQFIKLVDRQLDNQWGDKTHGFKPGDTYKINRAAQFSPVIGNSMAFNSSNGTFSTNSFVEDPIFVTLTTNDQSFIPVQFNSHELTTQLDNEESRVGEPAGLRLASHVEQKCILESALHGGLYGYSAGSTAAAADFLNASAKLSQFTAPEDGRSCLVPPAIMAQLSASQMTLFTPSKNDGEIYTKGLIGNFANSEFYSSNLIPDYPIVPGTVASIDPGFTWTEGAASIPCRFATTGFYPNGVILESSNKYRVNPETKAVTSVKYSWAICTPASYFGSTGYPVSGTTLTAPQQVYVNPAYVSANVLTYPAGATDVFGVNVTSASTAVNIYLDPSALIYSSADAGNRQNISAALAASDTLVVVGSTSKSYKQALMFTKEAITATLVPLTTDLPGADASRADHDGISLRVAVQAQVGTDVVYWRFDALSISRLLRDQYITRVLVG